MLVLSQEKLRLKFILSEVPEMILNAYNKARLLQDEEFLSYHAQVKVIMVFLPFLPQHLVCVCVMEEIENMVWDNMRGFQMEENVISLPHLHGWKHVCPVCYR